LICGQLIWSDKECIVALRNDEETIDSLSTF